MLQPYRSVKDLRTDVETSDTQGVLSTATSARWRWRCRVSGKSRAEAQAAD